jgi:hypothetical protein
MPRIQVPTVITKVVGEAPVVQRNPGDKGVTVLVEVMGGGTMVLKMTPDVASDLYAVVCEE